MKAEQSHPPAVPQNQIPKISKNLSPTLDIARLIRYISMSSNEHPLFIRKTNLQLMKLELKGHYSLNDNSKNKIGTNVLTKPNARILKNPSAKSIQSA